MEIFQSLQGLIRSPYTTPSNGMDSAPETTQSPPSNGQGDMVITLSDIGLRQSALALSADELSQFETSASNTTTIQNQINDALAEKNLDAATTDEIQTILDKFGLAGTQHDDPEIALPAPSTPISTSSISENNTDVAITSAPDGTHLENEQMDSNIQISSNNTNTTPNVQSNLPNGNLQSTINDALAGQNVDAETAGQIQDILDKFGMGGIQTGNNPSDSITTEDNGSPSSNQNTTTNPANTIANASANENANQSNNGYTPNSTQGSGSVSSGLSALQTQDYLRTRQANFGAVSDPTEHTLEPYNQQSSNFMEQQIARQNRLNGMQLLATQEYEQLNQLFNNMERFTDQLRTSTDEAQNRATSSSTMDAGFNDTQEPKAIAHTTLSSLLDESTVPTPNTDTNRHHRRGSVNVSA